jgi:MFS superfamily sulfate permease-like transporter
MKLTLVKQLRTYLTRDARHDIVAGLVVAAVAVPELIGIATIAGLPIQMGLYSALLAPVIFALFGSSHRLIVGADSATAVLLLAAASTLAPVGSPEYVAVVGVVSLLAACFLGLIALLRLNFLSDLISRPVMIGVLAGVGLQLMIAKFPEMLGVSLHKSALDTLTALPGLIGHINGMSVTIAILVLGIIVIFRRSRVPAPLLALIAVMVFASFVDLHRLGVAFVGAIPSGLPSIAIPTLSIPTIIGLVPAALSITLVILAQSTVVIRTTASEHDEPIHLRRDMIALSLAGVVSSLTHGFAINGSPPRTTVADIAGMKTQLASIVMSLVILLVLLFGGSFFSLLPIPALAAVVFAMGIYLIRWHELRYVLKTHIAEFIIATVALVGVVCLGVINGIILAVLLSLLERLRREYRPVDGILLRDGKLNEWAVERVGDVPSVPDDMIVYSFDGSLFFENSYYFTHRLKQALKEARHEVHSLIIDAGAIDSIDYTAGEQLKYLYRLLSADGIRLGFAHVSPDLKCEFDRSGVTDLVGAENLAPTLRAAIRFSLIRIEEGIRYDNIDIGSIAEIKHLHHAAADHDRLVGW